MPPIDLTAILAGLAVGVIVGLTGVGGGSLMTPLLIGAYRLTPAVAIGTDLWFAGLTKAAGAWAHWRHGQVERRIVVAMLAGSVPAALATLALLHALDLGRAWSATLTWALGVGLLLTAITVAYRPAWSRVGLALERRVSEAQRLRLTVVAGAGLGVLVTLSSIGAGAIGAALIVLLHPRLAAQRVVGTDIAHAVPLSLVAAIGHAWMGHVDWSLLGALLIGSLPGIWLGAHLSKALPERLVRGLLCLSLVGAGLKVIA